MYREVIPAVHRGFHTRHRSAAYMTKKTEGSPRSTIRHRGDNPHSTLGCSYCEQDTRENIHQQRERSLHPPKEPGGLEIADAQHYQTQHCRFGRSHMDKEERVLT